MTEASKTLERLMNEQKVTVAKLSELTGVSTLALEYVLHQHSLPKPHVAQKIAKVLHVPLRQIWPDLKQ